MDFSLHWYGGNIYADLTVSTANGSLQETCMNAKERKELAARLRELASDLDDDAG
jgi:hypothetical protein